MSNDVSLAAQNSQITNVSVFTISIDVNVSDGFKWKYMYILYKLRLPAKEKKTKQNSLAWWLMLAANQQAALL